MRNNGLAVLTVGIVALIAVISAAYFLSRPRMSSPSNSTTASPVALPKQASTSAASPTVTDSSTSEVLAYGRGFGKTDFFAIPLQGQDFSKDPLIDSYGRRADDALRKLPDVVKALTILYPRFDIGGMFGGVGIAYCQNGYVSGGNHVVKLNDGRTLFVMPGSNPGQSGLRSVAAFDVQSRNTYLLREEDPLEGTLALYGRPDEMVKNTLLHFFNWDDQTQGC